MAIIYSYPVYAPNGSDLLLGSKTVDVNGEPLPKNVTVNYTINALSSYIIAGIVKNIAWKFVISPDALGDRPEGSLSFDLYNNSVPFSDITTIKISESTSGGKYALEYLQALIGSNISIANSGDINNFGVYTLDSLTQDPTDPTFYNASVTFKAGNGSLQNTNLYYIESSAIGLEGDKNFVFVQTAPSAAWTVVHNLNKYPSVTVINNNNFVLYGEIEYIDINTLTITFSGGFSGKAYLN